MNERSAWFWCRLALLVGATAFTLLWIAGLWFGRQNIQEQPLSVWGAHGERLLAAPTGRAAEPFQFLALVTAKGTVVQRPPVFPGEFSGTLTEAAFLAAEDRNFFNHSGWSLSNLLLATVTGGHRGASTITQQYVRSQWQDFRHTAGRKWREMMVALAVESRLNKQAVLAGYWNTAYFGLDRDGKAIYGFTDASYRLLGKPPQALRPSESALLAGILRRANTATAEWRAGNTTRLAETRNSILSLMRKHWPDIFPEEALTAAISETVPRMARPASPGVLDDDCGRYFVDYARKQAQGYPAGSTILTTIDLPLQEEVCKVLKEEGQEIEARIRPDLSGQAGRLEVALVMLSADGAVRALSGGRDWRVSQYNRATAMTRSPGSGFKPLVYALALERGVTPLGPFHGAITLDPTVASIADPEEGPCDYDPPRGLLPRLALASSHNCAAEIVSATVGHKAVAQALAELTGGAIPATPRVALGSGAKVSPLGVATAYTVFANGGRVSLPRSIAAVGLTGAPMAEVAPEWKSGLDAGAVYIAGTWMSHVFDAGGSAPGGREAAGLKDGEIAWAKTGTSQDGDMWVMVVQPQLITVVRVGFDVNVDLPIEEGWRGGTVAVRIWARLMRSVRRLHPDWMTGEIPRPESVVGHRIDSSRGCKDPKGDLEELFLRGKEPRDCQVAVTAASGHSARP